MSHSKHSRIDAKKGFSMKFNFQNMTKFLTFSILLFSALSLWAKDPVYQKGGFAIEGYDAVAYFTDGKPTKGDPKYQFEYMGAKWLFASADHRDQFKADPEKYAPQYGGYCAYAVSKGSTAKIEPDAWKIVDGKLYLNYNHSIQKKWEKDISGHIKKADANWPKVIE